MLLRPALSGFIILGKRADRVGGLAEKRRIGNIRPIQARHDARPAQLDCGGARSSRILVFRRIWKKVGADVEDSKFVTSIPAEQRTTDHSSPSSPLWMGSVDKELPDGSYQVDLSGFLARDDIGIP